MYDYKIYTDGAYSSKTYKGGIGIVIIGKDKYQSHLSQGYSHTTNNRMELLAVIQGLKKIPAKSSIKIFSDSKYVTDAFNQKWIEKWLNNNWKTSAKNNVKNIDLWKLLIRLEKEHTIKWTWVKGHNNNKFNELADQLATSACSSKNLIADQTETEILRVQKNYHNLYIEFTVKDIAKTKKFFNKIFAWKFKDYDQGQYIEFFAPDITGGFYKTKRNTTTKNNNILAIFYAKKLNKMKEKIKKNGGIISQDIFSYPGGKRFHFLDPNDNEFAVYTNS